MDHEFEAGLLAVVDDALAAPLTIEAYKRFRQTYKDRTSVGMERATAHITRFVVSGRDPVSGAYRVQYPPGYFAAREAALDTLLPRERWHAFLDIDEHIEWAISDEFELNEQDLRDGYRPLDQFWPWLREWRERYRSAFGR